MEQNTQPQRPTKADPWEEMVTEWEHEGDLFKTGTQHKAKIINVDLTVAGEIFGEDAKNPDRKVARVTVAILPDERQTFSEVFSLPVNILSWNNAQFKLGMFKKRYGSVPKIGLLVDVLVQDKYFKIITA